MLKNLSNPLVLASIIIGFALIISSSFYFFKKTDLENCIDEYIGVELRKKSYIGSGVGDDQTYEYSEEQLKRRQEWVPEVYRSSAFYYCSERMK